MLVIKLDQMNPDFILLQNKINLIIYY